MIHYKYKINQPHLNNILYIQEVQINEQFLWNYP